jgi:hypothetical protein
MGFAEGGTPESEVVDIPAGGHPGFLEQVHCLETGRKARLGFVGPGSFLAAPSWGVSGNQHMKSSQQRRRKSPLLICDLSLCWPFVLPNFAMKIRRILDGSPESGKGSFIPQSSRNPAE